MPPAVQLALGRIFRLASRPTQPGDVQAYEEARHVVLAHYGDGPLPEAYVHNHVRDRNRGSGA